MLRIEAINTFYGDVQILFDVSLEIHSNEVITILGSNGAGKTTIIRSICNLVPISSGKIYFCNERLDRVPSYEFANRGISLVPEGRRLFPGMSVKDNLLLGAYTLKDKRQRDDNLEWVLGMFPRLRERSSQLAGTMSGGEQQMCAIARGLMIRPQFIIFDEPSLGLAPKIVDQIFQTVETIILEQGATILIVEQNANLALEASDRAYVLENGHITLAGFSKDLLESEQIQKAYLGF
jgi:branched-chain amino acid transport system ATP-binding protein